MNFFFRIFSFFASLELAVTLILTVAVALAVGTIYESKYSAAVASYMVYRSWWMQVLLWLFVVNLAAVAISRLPWKRHHFGFLVTHLGIIILLLGSWITQVRGVDGNLALPPGGSGRLVSLPENMVYVYKAVAGKSYDLLLAEPLHFDLRKPTEETRELPLGSGENLQLKVLRYFPRATRHVRAEDVPEGKGVPALKLRMLSSRANIEEWFFMQRDKGVRRELGPARLRFESGKPDLKDVPDKATLVLYLEDKPQLPPRLAVARKGEKFKDFGRIVPGKNIPLGWMDFSLVVDEYHPSAIPRAEYMALPGSGPAGENPLEALEVELGNEKLWLELGASGQVTHGEALYYVQFTRRQVDLGFDVMLNRFDIGYYEGTTRAKEYSSVVTVEGKEHKISMNEPLHHKQFTFYQASYEADDDGVPQLSVLSVNYDPGRTTKYGGSLMLVFGIISMFYFKPKYSGKNRWLAGRKEESV